MKEPRYPVENQGAEKAPEHGDEVEQLSQEADAHKQETAEPVYEDNYEEEFAQDVAAIPIDESVRTNEKETTVENDVKPGMGWFALAAAVLSFFLAPILLGGAGIVLGIVGKRRGADTLGNMAIIISVVSILFWFFFTPTVNIF